MFFLIAWCERIDKVCGSLFWIEKLNKPKKFNNLFSIQLVENTGINTDNKNWKRADDRKILGLQLK